MFRHMMKSKIHQAITTHANLNYHGSIAICPKLCNLADLLPNERVDIYNCNNGARISTYVITGETGQISVNGAAARHAQPNDQLIIVSYGIYQESELAIHKPRVIFVDKDNNPIEDKLTCALAS